jgi:hypothetical protein
MFTVSCRPFAHRFLQLKRLGYADVNEPLNNKLFDVYDDDASRLSAAVLKQRIAAHKQANTTSNAQIIHYPQ